MSFIRVGELELYINHLNIAFKGKKDEKERVVKAHIGSKILTSIEQDSQNNIQPASDSNSGSNSDRVERIVRSGSNSSKLNDSGDQEADSEQEQEAEEMILETSTSQYGHSMG